MGAADGSHSDRLRPECLSLVAREARWALVTPAAAATCQDFQAARDLVSALQSSWQPAWPAEKPDAERLVEVLTARLSLDRDDRGQLLEDMGLARPRRAVTCSWFPCRL